MNFKVRIDDSNIRNKKVYVTIGVTGEFKSLESRTGDWLGRILPSPCAIDGDPTDPRSLYPWLVAEKFVTNYEDCRIADVETSGENITFTFKVRNIPEKWKWGGQKVVTYTPPKPKRRKPKFKSRTGLDRPLDEVIEQESDSSNKDV